MNTTLVVSHNAIPGEKRPSDRGPRVLQMLLRRQPSLEPSSYLPRLRPLLIYRRFSRLFRYLLRCRLCRLMRRLQYRPLYLLRCRLLKRRPLPLRCRLLQLRLTPCKIEAHLDTRYRIDYNHRVIGRFLHLIILEVFVTALHDEKLSILG